MQTKGKQQTLFHHSTLNQKKKKSKTKLKF